VLFHVASYVSRLFYTVHCCCLIACRDMEPFLQGITVPCVVCHNGVWCMGYPDIMFCNVLLAAIPLQGHGTRHTALLTCVLCAATVLPGTAVHSAVCHQSLCSAVRCNHSAGTWSPCCRAELCNVLTECVITLFGVWDFDRVAVLCAVIPL
jgi:hypothetical protein